MDRLKKQITLLWVPENKQADEEAKAALDDDIQQNEEHPPKDLEKDQKRAMEKRKQQHARKKDRTQI
jgi:hypothetical protein